MDMDSGGKGRDEEQDGMSVHSPCKAPLSSASSLPKEESQVELELRLLEALEIYPPVKLQGIHRHFVLYGLMEFLRKRFFPLNKFLSFVSIPRFWSIDFCKPSFSGTFSYNMYITVTALTAAFLLMRCCSCWIAFTT
ncbi:hypothetical protein I3760_06G092400 [Carya illinoinensis]|nr:hypothetical protein I3760_06G092400 [Carya illinoinensis]